MSDIFVFFICVIIAIRTFGYGLWTISSKNILGGFFIIKFEILLRCGFCIIRVVEKNIKFIHSDSFHDRFIIIDKQVLYHCGSSFKDLGKKYFAISRIEDIKILNNLIKEISS